MNTNADTKRLDWLAGYCWQFSSHFENEANAVDSDIVFVVSTAVANFEHKDARTAIDNAIAHYEANLPKDMKPDLRYRYYPTMVPDCS